MPVVAEGCDDMSERIYEEWVALVDELCECESCTLHRTKCPDGLPCMCVVCKNHTKFKVDWESVL